MSSTAYDDHHPSTVITEVGGADDVRYNIAFRDEERYNELVMRIQGIRIRSIRAKQSYNFSMTRRKQDPS